MEKLNKKITTLKPTTPSPVLTPPYLNLKKPLLLSYQDDKADPLHIGNESAFCKVVFLWKSKLKSPDLKE